VVVLEGLGYAFAYGFEAGEVDDGVEAVFGEDAVEGLAVAYIDVVVLDFLADELAYALEGFGLGIDEVIDYDHAVAGFVEFDDGVRGDEAGTAGE